MAHVANLYKDGELIAEKLLVSWHKDIKAIGEIYVTAGTELHSGTHYQLAFPSGGILQMVISSTPIPSFNDGWIRFKPIHWVVEP